MKDFIPYEEALELEHLDFDEQCLAYYNVSELSSPVDKYGICVIIKSKSLLLVDDYKYFESVHGEFEVIKAPLYQQTFRWFREKYGLVGIVKFGTNDFTYNIYNVDAIGLLTKESLNFNGTYEEAEIACLKKLIEIVKQKQ